MGSWISSIMGQEREAEGHDTGLGYLPESCLAEVLLHLDPLEICQAARLSRAFRGAASADFVWETKLPKNYGHLMELASDEKSPCKKTSLCKKEIYARLCRPNPFDGGTKVSSISFSSKYMNRIAGIGDFDVKGGIFKKEVTIVLNFFICRFHMVAYLRQIWWFEVDGEIDFCFPAGTYSLFFRLHLGRASKRFGRRICSSEHIHGWDKKPMRFQLATSNSQQTLSQCYLGNPGSWILCYAGDFVADRGNVATKLKFSMTQIDCTHTKGGLCVDSVLICPKGFRQGKVCSTRV
ncbi:hypothetical protein B296_00024374 [Ensete ventricosum]|uniref:F-box domain-containing protein n=1 Tax=Ensete ventricosum TaxID=4639 RepID=A0A426XZD3_ENSVE|nr:hypothetical protein B296_00024374 [Ensete ventricosum]